MDSLRLHIKGHVQGVSFRAHTQKKATELGITGWVRNLPDGSVEALAQGPKDKLESLLEWARRGPTAAQVTEVIPTWESVATNAETSFTIKY